MVQLLLAVQKLTEGKQHQLTAVQRERERKKEKLSRLTCQQSGRVPDLRVCAEAGLDQLGGASLFLYKGGSQCKKSHERKITEDRSNERVCECVCVCEHAATEHV